MVSKERKPFLFYHRFLSFWRTTFLGVDEPTIQILPRHAHIYIYNSSELRMGVLWMFHNIAMSKRNEGQKHRIFNISYVRMSAFPHLLRVLTPFYIQNNKFFHDDPLGKGRRRFPMQSADLLLPLAFAHSVIVYAVLYACRHHDTSVAERVPADCRRNGTFYVDGCSTCRSVCLSYVAVSACSRLCSLLTIHSHIILS